MRILNCFVNSGLKNTAHFYPYRSLYLELYLYSSVSSPEITNNLNNIMLSEMHQPMLNICKLQTKGFAGQHPNFYTLILLNIFHTYIFC